VADKPGDADVAKANEANNEEVIVTKEIKANVINVDNYAIVADNANGAVLYSLTKYSAICAEVKGYFGITSPDNQLGRRSSFFLKSNNQLECLESGWSKLCSLRNQYRY
jgi:hypothetical protein